MRLPGEHDNANELDIVNIDFEYTISEKFVRKDVMFLLKMNSYEIKESSYERMDWHKCISSKKWF